MLINEFINKLNSLIEQYEYKIRMNNSRIEAGDNSNDKRIIQEILANMENVDLIEKNIVTIRNNSSEANIRLLNNFLKQYRALKPNIREKMYAYNKDRIENAIKDADARIIIIDLDKIRLENSKLQDRIDKMKTLATKISNYDITEEDLAVINHFCNTFNINRVELVASIAIEALREPYGYVQTEEEDVQALTENQVSLTEDELTNLFASYGCDYTKLAKEKKDKLLKYGNIDKIRSIIETFNSYNIDLSSPYRGGTLFINSFSINILIYSDAESVKRALETLKAYNLLTSEEAIADSLKSHKFFVSRKRKYKEKIVNSNGKETSEIISGGYEDLNNNLDYFYGIYKKLMKSLNSNISETELLEGFKKNVFDGRVESFSLSSDGIKNTIKEFDTYGILEKQYITTLSCFNRPRWSSIFDQLLEVDCFDYAINNLSRMLIKGTMESMIYAKQNLGWANEDLFRAYADNSIFRVSSTRPVLSAKKLNETLRNLQIIPSKIKLAESFIPDDKKEIFGEIKEIVDKDFKFGARSFFDNYAYFKKIVEDKGFEYFDAIKKYISNKNPLVLDIDGVLVSVNKLIRIYSIYNNHSMLDTKDRLLFALTYNSHYTEEQFNIIKKHVDEISIGQRGRELVR